MSRIRPWVKKTLLVSVIIVAVGAGLSVMAGEFRGGRDVTKVVRVSQEFHGRPAGDMKVEIRGGENTAVLAQRGEDATVPIPPIPPIAPVLRDGGIHIEGYEHGVGPGVAVGGTILIAGLILFWMSKRGKRSRVADGANVLASIPSASDFLDQWEIQQNQTKESK
ncbi:hypothetical protein FE783_13850 [Paenibacillus mesophilus]|uniref:hypothetical protein n=1 Tax=Paenibacillus mesophilus TaxID=2582849 RepID=UPI00110DC2B0|nr:hypothetical protein [Paenibacillus mesophilus]TMV49578.1 hypothetical protein FE783_13850 [Paenibacillus mesophilus]